MLNLLRNNSPFTVIILIIYAFVVNWYVLFHPQLPVYDNNNFLYTALLAGLDVILFKSAFGYTLLAVVLLILQALYLNSIVNKHKLYNKSYYIIAFVYLSLTSVFPAFRYFSQVLILNWLLMMLLDTMLYFPQSNKPRAIIYNAGFITGCLALVHFPAVIYVLLLLIGLSMLRSFNPGEWIVAILGCLTPVYFAVGILFLADSLPMFPGWVNMGMNLPRRMPNPLYIIGTITMMVTLFATGVFTLQGQMNRVSIFVRRSWTTLSLSLFLSLLVAAFSDFNVKSAWLVIMVPLTLIISNVFYSEKNRGFSSFAFYLLLLLVIFTQVTVGSGTN